MDEDAREGIRRDRKFKCMFASEWEIKYLNIGSVCVSVCVGSAVA
jgi:hypothetical protein